MTDKESYRPDEVADALNISIWTVYRLLKKGKIKHCHLGKSHRAARIPRNEVERILKEGVNSAKSS